MLNVNVCGIIEPPLLEESQGKKTFVNKWDILHGAVEATAIISQ
jgi:hypothetical protein